MDTETKKQLGAILAAIKGLDARLAKIEGGDTAVIAEKPKTKTKKLSIREFLMQHPPITDVQRTLVIGRYLEEHEGMTSFTKVDLERGYRDAKHPVPSNVNMNIKQNVAAGNMMDTKAKKDNITAYTVTATGEAVIAKGFQKASGK